MPAPLIQPTRILVLGSGGREHALAWKLAAEPGVNEVFVAPGSDGIAEEPRVRRLADTEPLDPAAVVEAARTHSIELVVVGPEGPLAAGVADALEEAGIAVCGPTAAAARIETSKAFCHEVAEAAGVRMARARSFPAGAIEAATTFVRELAGRGDGVVLKADGLASGKGVIVYDDAELALEQLPSFLAGHAAGHAAGHPVRHSADRPALVVEERLHGREASVIAVCDGERAVALPAARDHKRLCDGDRGPNTGGMGAYSPVPDLPDIEVEAIVRTIHVPILTELARRGSPFRGFLYAGLMLTDDGPVLLECNARLGDPEAQAILPRLAGPLAPWLRAAARGALSPDAPARLAELPGATVAIVLAAQGYPHTPKRGHPIDGIDEARARGALVFHAGTVRRSRPGGGYGTNGGRILAVVGRGVDVPSARSAAESAADLVTWEGLQRRRDIALDVPPAPARADVRVPA
jgi:phosphoribosylamine--glycine ligase